MSVVSFSVQHADHGQSHHLKSDLLFVTFSLPCSQRLFYHLDISRRSVLLALIVVPSQDRRSINRKSAQKHRTRRKEELDHLNRQLAQRDARIATLEKEIAVQKAKTDQLVEFIQMHAKGSREKP